MDIVNLHTWHPHWHWLLEIFLHIITIYHRFISFMFMTCKGLAHYMASSFLLFFQAHPHPARSPPLSSAFNRTHRRNPQKPAGRTLTGTSES